MAKEDFRPVEEKHATARAWARQEWEADEQDRQKQAAGKRHNGRQPGNFGSQMSEPSRDLFHSLSADVPNHVQNPSDDEDRGSAPQVLGAPLGSATCPRDEAQHAQPIEASANREPDGQVMRRHAIRKAGGGSRAEVEEKLEGRTSQVKKTDKMLPVKMKVGDGILGLGEAAGGQDHSGFIRTQLEKKIKQKVRSNLEERKEKDEAERNEMAAKKKKKKLKTEETSEVDVQGCEARRPRHEARPASSSSSYMDHQQQTDEGITTVQL